MTELTPTEHDEIEVEAEGIEVSCQPIELYKVLKIANVVEGGGDAKNLIADGFVAVNGEIETRKRRKLYDGDVVYFDEAYFVVLCDQPVTERTPKTKESKTAQPKSRSKKALNKKQPDNARSPAGRRAIKF